MKPLLSSDAAIALRNAGYETRHCDYHQGKPLGLMVGRERLLISDGRVDHVRVTELLKEKGR